METAPTRQRDLYDFVIEPDLMHFLSRNYSFLISKDWVGT